MSLQFFTDPSPQGRLAGKLKKALFITLAVSEALSFIIAPIIVSANFFTDILGQTTSPSFASDISFNSQNIPLLAAATNINPNPSVDDGDITLASGDALLPIDNPDGADADTVSTSANSQISVYVVRDGDTLSSIAALFDVSTNTIIGANDIKDGVIHPGEQLIILPITGIEHTVQEGETIAGLATKFNSDAADIASYNNLAVDEALTVGQTIIIPNGELAATPTNANTSTSVKTKITTKVVKTTPTTKANNKGFVPAPLRDAGGPEYDGYYAWPMPLSDGIITQSLHGYNAVDIGTPTGTDIYAAAAGTVIIAKDDGAWNGGYGNYIVISHNNSTQTLYAHASKVLVSPGDEVAQGELIGKVGRTGEATGPHLHFEVRGATNPFGAIPVGSGE